MVVPFRSTLFVLSLLFLSEKREKQGAVVQVASREDSKGHVMKRSAVKQEESVGSHVIRITDAWGGSLN